jgi:hypothetical protein
MCPGQTQERDETNSPIMTEESVQRDGMCQSEPSTINGNIFNSLYSMSTLQLIFLFIQHMSKH